jgi:hypothetical protein
MQRAVSHSAHRNSRVRANDKPSSRHCGGSETRAALPMVHATNRLGPLYRSGRLWLAVLGLRGCRASLGSPRGKS